MSVHEDFFGALLFLPSHLFCKNASQREMEKRTLFREYIGNILCSYIFCFGSETACCTFMMQWYNFHQNMTQIIQLFLRALFLSQCWFCVGLSPFFIWQFTELEEFAVLLTTMHLESSKKFFFVFFFVL